MQDRHPICDLHDIFDCGNLQGQRQVYLLADFQLQGAVDSAKTWGLHGKLIAPRQQGGNLENAMIITGDVALRARVHRDQLHHRVGERTPLGIKNSAPKHCVIALGKRRERKQEHKTA